MKSFENDCPLCGEKCPKCTCVNKPEHLIDPAITDMIENFPELNEKALYPTGLEEAIIGRVERFGMDPLILLDRDKCISIFIERDGMEPEEAEEFFEFNVIGAWMGEGTPCFATLLK